MSSAFYRQIKPVFNEQRSRMFIYILNWFKSTSDEF